MALSGPTLLLAWLLLTLSAAALAGAAVLWRSPPRMPSPRALPLGLSALAAAALAALWRLWSVGVDPSQATPRYIAVFALVLLATLVAFAAGADMIVAHAAGRRRKERDEALAVQKEVEQFTAATAHDLKSPLRSIYSSAALLQRRLGRVEHDVLEGIKDSSRRMTAMVEELLKYTSIANTAPSLQDVRFLRLAQEIEVDLQELIERRAAVVEWRGGGTLYADPALMARAVRNLVENAIKYGPEGGHVIVSAEPFFGGLRVMVTDQGPGVPEGERERIFEVFQRGSTTANTPGTGLGLATVAKVAQLHSGNVGVETAEGAGSRFWLWVPGPSDPARKPVPSVEPIVGAMPVLT